MSPVRIFKSRIIEQQLGERELRALVEDFKAYKQTGLLPDTFGRDAPYNHPNGLPTVKAEQLSHLHLCDAEEPWPRRAAQFRRTSDIHLVYCQGFSDESTYLLMAILAPDAHAQARDNTRMYHLAKMAERFRSQY